MGEDPRIQKDGICGITHIGPGGHEWVCIRRVHQTVYHRKTSGKRTRKGDPIYDSNPSAYHHYFVPRWPYRKNRG